MAWRKLGRVYVAEGQESWALTHAAIPTAMMLDRETIRVFVAFVDDKSVGRIGYVDVASRDPTKVLAISREPVLDIGPDGTFDDNGVNPLSLVVLGERVHLYYAGWQLGVKVRYFLFLGLAVSEDSGATFRKNSRVPVLERSDAEPLIRSSAHVHAEQGRWRMWYAGGDSWTLAGDRMRPSYQLRYLQSRDGITWGSEGKVCLDFEHTDEFGFGRPFVVPEGERLRMWYSIRTRSCGYRIGYAESTDGLAWRRMDSEAGIDVSPEGWDSEMICYPCVQDTVYGRYLFYNGNNYGETGFGVAIAES